MYHRRRNVIIFLLLSAVFGVIAFVYGMNKNLPITDTIIAGLFMVFIVFLFSHYQTLLG